MMKFDYGYKYFCANLQENKLIIIELSKDNFLGKKLFSAKSNYLFYDSEEESFGHASGVGKTEKEALNMCANEIKKYIGKDISFQDFDCPQRITFENNKKIDTLYFKVVDDKLHILTGDGIQFVKLSGDVFDSVIKYCKHFNGKSLETTDVMFEENNFVPIFENTFEKY